MDQSRAVVVVTHAIRADSEKGRFVITGIDTSDGNQGKPTFKPQAFETTKDKASERPNRVVLKPFNIDPWRGKYVPPKAEKATPMK